MSDARDDDLLAEIATAHDELSPVPAHLLAAAKDAFGWRRADAELAELLFDSAEADLVGVRGARDGADRRSFRYGHGDFVIRVHLTRESLIVMVEPPVSVACRVVTEEATGEHRTDDFGELAVAAPDLPTRIEVDLPGGAVVTPWITG
ncbi:MAG: hypothetical protein HKN41_06100 [Ilumatobacter sp.]|nr:hypothetical protein [Ilumatobacter sp.]